MQDQTIHEAIYNLLRQTCVVYKEIQHGPVRTSREAALARGDDEVGMGGKALVLKVGEEFRLFVLSGALKIDQSAVKEYFRVKKFRFASHNEVYELTGLAVGTIPPFGRPILNFELFADPSILSKKKIGFNAASLTQSIVMSVDDWVKIAKPAVFRFACPS